MKNAYARRKVARKPRRKNVKKVSKFGPAKSTSYAQNYACSVESYQTTIDIQPNQAYSLAPTLAQFARSRSIAENYQFYRCTELEYKFEPLYNTFQDVSGGASVPQLFWLMNRSGTQPNVLNVPWLQSQGAKPHKLIKDYVIKYAPSTLAVSSAQNLTVPSGTSAIAYVPKWKQWLNTYTEATSGGTETVNDAIRNYGHFMMIDQEFDANSNPVARMTVTAKWEFNKPYLVAPTAGVAGTTEVLSL